MSKKKKTSATPKSVKTVLFSIIPVLSALVLILIVGVTISLVSNMNNRKPTISKGDDVYFEFEQMKVTKNELYANMKIEYGAAELIRLIDEAIYAKQIEESKNDETKEAIRLYIIDQLFGLDSKEELEQNEDNQKIWDELVDSLEMNNLITAEQIGTGSNLEVTNFKSTIWDEVIDHYRLQFVRNTEAKNAYVEQWKENKEAENEKNKVENIKEYFTEKELKEKYEAEYEATTYGLFIPFTSEKAAKAMMDKFGINTQNSTSINQNGWISSKYDYNANNSGENKKSDLKLSNLQVMEIFYKMYNEVLGHYQLDENGNPTDIIDLENDIDKSLNYSAAFNEAYDDLEEKLKDYTVKGTVTLPTSITVAEGVEITVEWVVTENDYVALTNNQLTLKSTTAGDKGVFEISATLKLTIDKDEFYERKLEIDINSEVKAEAEDETISVTGIEAEGKYILTKEFLKKFEGEGVESLAQFAWTNSELAAIDSALATSLKPGGTLKPIVGHDEHVDFYKSYTVAPIKGTNFYFLAVKFYEVEAEDFDTVKASLEEKLLEDLKTDNNASKVIYENRNKAELKIYDKYLEAIYEYDYKNFFENTIKLTNYTKFEISKKREKTVVASFKVDGVEHKITADELYASLEEKYGVSIIIDFMNSYQIVGNDTYNKFYNPYTGKVTNEKAIKELFEGEVSSFRNNFELDYFTYSYLTYYGFIPNFPGSYGWNDFRTDYFGAFSDRDLLTNSAFGGFIYTDALDALKETVYLNDYNKNNADNKIESYDALMLKLIGEQIEKIEKEHYSLNVVNLIISLDTNYDGTANNPLEEGEWTETQTTKAKELAKKMYELAPSTLKTTLADQLAAIVVEYNEASSDHEVWGEYKQLGLLAKAEAANTYTNTSSIVEEFADVLQVLWDKIDEKEALGETLDAPLMSEEPFPTMYGYHHIAVINTTEVTPLEEKAAQVEIYYALNAYTSIKDNTYSFMQDEIKAKKEALETVLAKYGYNLELSKKENLNDEEKEQLAKSKADFLEKYGFDIDALAFNEATQKALETYYEAALTEVENGDQMTNFTISVLKEKDFEFKYNKKDRNAQLQKIVEVTEKTLEEEGENA